MDVAAKELSRQFRVLRQMVSIHAILRDCYSRRGLFVDILLLACSVVFCATTFARDDLFIQLGLTPSKIRYLLGAASALAFLASLVTLRTDWKGKAAGHREAVQKLARILSLFRECKQDDGAWPKDRTEDLHKAYWEVMNNIVEIPDRLFVSLKARHLRKMEISKMSDTAPGCPLFVLRLILLKRSMSNACRRRQEIEEVPTDAKRP